jgi:pimeloyl-ACP methyl ester carboxylesterase
MNQAVWAPQVQALRRDVRVITYDMLGHGGSSLPGANPTLEEYAVQLAALLDGLQIEAAHIVGHSMGALVALEFALRYPARALSVVTLNAVYDRTPDQREAVMRRAAALQGANRDGVSVDAARDDPSIDATIARWFDDPVPVHLVPIAGLVRSLLRMVNPLGYARTYQLFASSDAAHVGRLPQLSMPALFMTGECDPNSSPAMSRAMAAAAPRARAEIIASERHMMNVTAPELVNRSLLQFVRQAGNATRQA